MNLATFYDKVNPFRLYRVLKCLDERNQARRLLKASLEAGFDMPDIRRGLIAFYGINVSSLVSGNGVKPASLYAAINGDRLNGEKAEKAKKIIARALGLQVPELFPDAESPEQGRRADSAPPGTGKLTKPAP